MTKVLSLSVVAALASTVLAAAALAQQPAGAELQPAGMELDQAIGAKFHIKAEELPAPKTTHPVSNGPLALPYQDQAPKVPEGFTATLVAKLENPRRLLVLPNGDI